MENYFRITGYEPKEDYCFIMDCYGKHEKLWQFSSALVQKGIKIIEASKLENIIDLNIKPIEKQDTENYIVRATANGEPKHIEQYVDGITYKAIKVGDKIYIPSK